jgi:hypothetical protein
LDVQVAAAEGASADAAVAFGAAWRAPVAADAMQSAANTASARADTVIDRLRIVASLAAPVAASGFGFARS